MVLDFKIIFKQTGEQRAIVCLPYADRFVRFLKRNEIDCEPNKEIIISEKKFLNIRHQLTDAGFSYIVSHL